jgi:hypothetical protein
MLGGVAGNLPREALEFHNLRLDWSEGSIKLD